MNAACVTCKAAPPEGPDACEWCGWACDDGAALLDVPEVLRLAKTEDEPRRLAPVVVRETQLALC